MRTTCIFAAAVALATSVVAQQQSSTGSSGPTPTGSSASPSESATIIEIAVGANPHEFTPKTVTAKVGDTIRFNFYPGGHRVARSEWKRPCIPYEITGANRKGFYSGVFNPQIVSIPLPHYDVRVNDTDPIFFYCGAPGSCFEYGMVGIVNPTKDMPFEEFQKQALNQTFQLLPGEPWPSETLPPTSSPTSPATTGGANSGENGQQSSEQGGSGLSTGAIAGIAIGGVAVLILGGALIYLCGRRGGFDKAYRKGAVPGAGAGATNGEGLTPAMIEAKYSGSPKSPGQATVATFGAHDPYRMSAQSPHAQHFNNGTPPPPMSPGLQSGYGSYGGTLVPGAHFPGMGDGQPQYAYQHGNHSPQPLHSPQFQTPVELPSAEDPSQGQKPPQYAGDRDSWTAGQDPAFRPGKP